MLIAAYAVLASKCDASMSETFAHGVELPAASRSSSVLPPSRVTWISPSSVPAQMRVRVEWRRRDGVDHAALRGVRGLGVPR